MEELFDYLVARGVPRWDVTRGAAVDRVAGRRYDVMPADLDLLAVGGMAGVGKTACLLSIARRLVSQGVERDRILWLDCADARLRAAGPLVPAMAVDSFLRRDPRLRGRRCHVFLDNVDAVDGWQAGVARILDVYDMRFVVAGRGIGAIEGALAEGGRRCGLRELDPLGFSDFCEVASDGPCPDRYAPGSVELVDRYLVSGGLPGFLSDAENAGPTDVQALVERTLLRGAGMGGKTADPAVGLAFSAFVLEHATEAVSITEAARVLRQTGVVSSRAMLSTLLDRFEQLRLVHAVGVHGCPDPGAARLPRAVYAADNSLVGAYSPYGAPRRLAMMRNAAFLDLRRCNPRGVFSYRAASGRMVDFACSAAVDQKVDRLVHVVDDRSDPRAVAKALRLLDHAMLRAGLADAELVTAATEALYRTDNGTVRAVPIWEWLTDGGERGGAA